MRYRSLILVISLISSISTKAQKKRYAFEDPCIKDGKQFGGRKLTAKFYSKMLNDTTWGDTIKGNPVTSEDEVVRIGEEELIKRFGKKLSKDEKPYEVYLINGFWILMGTLPDGCVGGTGHVIIKAKNGAVLRMWHEQ